jgi:hypothetical protein
MRFPVGYLVSADDRVKVANQIVVPELFLGERLPRRGSDTLRNSLVGKPFDANAGPLPQWNAVSDLLVVDPVRLSDKLWDIDLIANRLVQGFAKAGFVHSDDPSELDCVDLET